MSNDEKILEAAQQIAIAIRDVADKKIGGEVALKPIYTNPTKPKPGKPKPGKKKAEKIPEEEKPKKKKKASTDSGPKGGNKGKG